MLTDILLKFVNYLLDIIHFIIPNWNLGDPYYAGLANFVTGISQWNEFIPTNAMLTVFITIITFEIIILLIKTISGAVSLVRGGGKLEVD